MNITKTKNKIIIIGGNHHNTLGLIRSVGELGLPVIVLLEPCDLHFCNLRFSKYITRLHLLNSTNEAINILQKDYWTDNEKGIIICGSDTSISLLDANYDKLKNHFFIFNAKGQQNRINYYLNKIHTFPLAQESGLSIIKTWHIYNSNEIPNDITYPCIIKGNNSTISSKEDMFICNNIEELKGCLKDGTEYLIQEYINKEFELDAVGFAYNKGSNIYMPCVIRKIRDELNNQSYYTRLDDIKEYPQLNTDSIKRFIQGIGYEGIFSIEFLYKDNKFYFLEINMRNDGTGYIYTSAGVNYPLLWILYCTNNLTSSILNSIKIKTPFYSMQITDISNVIKKKVSFWEWVKQAYKTDTYFVFNKHDIVPFLYQIYIPIRQLVKKLYKH